MVVLDVAIVNVALPKMRAGLGLSATGQQWVVNAYTLTFAGMMLLGGRIADLFGRRRVFMLALAVFTLCSLLGGLAQSGGTLIAARAAQGVGGALLAPATLSLITTTFIDPAARRRAVGAWSATAASGAAAGSLTGGILTDLLGWRWVLFVNVPLGAFLIAASAVALSESRGEVRPRLDVAGAVTVTGGLTLLVYGIVSTDIRSWGSAATISTLIGGVALLTAFAVIEARVATHPLVPLHIFGSRSISTANGIAVTIGAALYGLYFFLSLYLQQVDGYSPLKAGLAFLPAALSTMVGALAGARLVTRLGARRQLVLGPLVGAAGLLWLRSLSVSDGYLGHVLGPLVLSGMGLGLSFVPMTIAATAGVPASEAGLASGLINSTRQIGGALGLAVMATAAAGASSAAVGYDRAFTICATAVLIGAALALALPGRPTRTRRTPSSDNAPEPIVVESPTRQPEVEADHQMHTRSRS
jgi:EmrB/QacA subfamily drug resistance transporter